MDNHKVFNGTMHKQHEFVQHFADAGFPLVDPDPHGFQVPLRASMDQVVAKTRSMLQDAARSGARYVLLGGLTSVGVAAERILAGGLEPKAFHLGLCEVETERVRDEADRFVFQFRGLRVVREPAPTKEEWEAEQARKAAEKAAFREPAAPTPRNLPKWRTYDPTGGWGR